MSHLSLSSPSSPTGNKEERCRSGSGGKSHRSSYFTEATTKIDEKREPHPFHQGFAVRRTFQPSRHSCNSTHWNRYSLFSDHSRLFCLDTVPRRAVQRYLSPTLHRNLPDQRSHWVLPDSYQSREWTIWAWRGESCVGGERLERVHDQAVPWPCPVPLNPTKKREGRRE